jgi:hypothetical protein
MIRSISTAAWSGNSGNANLLIGSLQLPIRRLAFPEFNPSIAREWNRHGSYRQRRKPVPWESLQPG